MKKILFFLCFLSILSSCIREESMPITIEPLTGAVVSPDVGGPAEPNQVWINLATNTVKVTPREIWDLGFYCGPEFRVMMNSSLVMSAGKIEGVSDIDAVNSAMVVALKDQIRIKDHNPISEKAKYIDHPDGQLLTQTSGIAPVSINDSENPVYLLNMGHSTYTGTTSPGSFYAVGKHRGYKKIRILRNTNDDYVIQYADLDDTTHKEFTIPKDSESTIRYFSIQKDGFADLELKKKDWDLCFTVMTNLVQDASQGVTSPAPYIFGDMVLHNTLSSVGAYQVTTEPGKGEYEYNLFSMSNVVPGNFITNDQRAIGENWRTQFGESGTEVFTDRFFVLRNADGIYFKLRFLRVNDEHGNRGYPQFEYKPL